MNGALQEKDSGRRIDLGETMIIGRRDDCQLVLNDAKISRQHAMIRRQNDGYWFYDLGSSNGSYLNEKRVVTTQKLANRDVIRLGRHQYVFVSGEITQVLREGVLPEPDYSDLSATVADIRMVPVMMLVSDIKGFTLMSERVPPDVLAQSIGSWYRECSRVLGEFGATIDKFIGDCVLAYWLETSHDSRRQAIIAARRLREASHGIIAKQQDVFDGHEIHLDTGIGLHLGNVAHGAMSQGTFTLLGDAVNATFRLEALTRKLDKDVLVSGEFLNGWDEGAGYCQSLGSHKVKGRKMPLDVYSVESWPDDSKP